MKNKDVYIGAIKKCYNAYAYKEYGDKRYIPDFMLGNMEVGSTEIYAEIIDKQAVLIKVKEHEFILLNSLITFKDNLFIDLGIPVKIIKDYPEKNNDLFVVKESLIPYYENIEKENKNIKVKTLRKDVLQDPRLKGGIEH